MKGDVLRVAAGIVLTALLGALSACQGTEAPSEGQAIFQRFCANCHQSDASGVAGAYPSLRDNEWVQSDPGRLIRLLLFGMQGPVTVKGESFNNAMPPHAFLNDAQIAGVLTYVRSHFDNEADPVLEEWVTRVRAKVQRERSWHPAELEGETGIP